MAEENNQDLDLSLLNEIADGSDEFIVDSISMFLEQTPVALTEIANNIAEGKWSEAAGAAHKIKATLGFFGMLNSQALMQQIEAECKAGGTPGTSSIFTEAKAIIEGNIPALQQIQAEASARL